MAKTSKVNIELLSYLASFTHDPLKFVYAAFPWGEEGPLKDIRPQEWQKEILKDIRDGFKTPDEAIQVAVTSGHGVGKAHRNSMVLDTPDGRRVWGDLKPWDRVFDAYGNPTEILATRKYTQIPFYRVTFDDGSYTDVSSGHVWTVRGRRERRNHLPYWRNITTEDLYRIGAKRKNGAAMARQWEIPIQGAARFTKKKVPVDSYALGVWIGDGARGAARYTKPYPEIVKHIQEAGYKVKKGTRDVYYIHGIQAGLRELGLLDTHSYERFIPDEYKYNDVKTRKELLYGLMDTDGEVTNNHSLGYSTTSERLANDIIWLVRSLGGKARKQPTDKKGWYYNENREKVSCKTCYRITITLPFNPFRIKHRAERYKPNTEHRYLCRWIDSIEPIGNHDGQCIEAASLDHLYLANDFIVTHNSALVSWLILWAMTTHEDTRGVVTANTDGQLKSKTWPELSTWYSRFIMKDLFTLTATSLFVNQEGHERTWRIDAIPWSERNTEAFAGLHNHGKRILIVFDEASAIIDKIWEVTEGAMSDNDTEKIWVAFGNPTRTSGRFYDCFHKFRKYWHTKKVDSRTVPISDKKKIADWAEQWGEDSDFFKVRVKGEFPSASDSQFISGAIVDKAIKRIPNPLTYEKLPAIIGVDPAWTGSDALEVVLRRGPFYKHLLTMEKNDDDIRTAGIIARFEDQYNAAAVFIDSGYGTGIYSAGKSMGRFWKLVSFAEKPTKAEYANKRAEMWGEMKRWLIEEGYIEDDQQLKDDLTGPEAYINLRGKLQLESKDDMKKRGLPSPNKADALALTFAYPVLMQEDAFGGQGNMCNTEYNPFD